MQSLVKGGQVLLNMIFIFISEKGHLNKLKLTFSKEHFVRIGFLVLEEKIAKIRQCILTMLALYPSRKGLCLYLDKLKFLYSIILYGKFA